MSSSSFSRLNRLSGQVLSHQGCSSKNSLEVRDSEDEFSFSKWAAYYPASTLGDKKNPRLENFVNGSFCSPPECDTQCLPDPMTGAPMLHLPLTDGALALEPFLMRMKEVPKSGLHNPLKNVDRYVKYGEISFRLAKALDDQRVADHFAQLIIRCVPKSYMQSIGEVNIVKQFLKNFGGDQVRFLGGRGFSVSGDHDGQESKGYRWPFGAVVIIAPFNFPLEIPVLQLMGALYMGNHVSK